MSSLPYRGLGLLVALTLIACSGAIAPTSSTPGGTGTGTATSGGPAQAVATKVTMVSQTLNPPALSNLYYWVAKNKGTFSRNGLDVEFQQSGTNNTANAVVMNGTAQFASTSLTGVAGAVAAGSAAHIVVVGMWNFPYFLIAKDSVKTVNDMNGKIAATSGLGEFTHLLSQAYFQSQGLDQNAVQWVATGNAGTVAQYLISGKVDLGPLTVDQSTLAMKQNPSLHVLAGPEELRKVYPVSGGVIEVADQYAAEHPDIVQRFSQAIVEAARLMYEDPAAYKEVANQIMPGQYSDDDLTKIYDTFKPYFGVNGGFQDQQFNVILKQVQQQDATTADRIGTLDKVIDRQFVTHTLDQVGVFTGTEDDAAWYKARS